ncbi:hypothetical protein Golob_025944 [Gossypium lobatum]|uniref:Uncharacterized protein n=1 Tax=Gossypium lobatum TaxID=34289 RepID=A0A7J8LTL1_9ROSI|nr:hypothetical protein [Gossypium lobatum]
MRKSMILEICGHLQKDVALQLNLSVDGPVITRSVVVPSKVDICRALLGKVLDKWNHKSSYVGLSEELEDFSLLLDQQLKAKFEWMSYADIDIISCILSEVLANWEMWRQRISSPSRYLNELHKVDVQGKNDDD